MKPHAFRGKGGYCEYAEEDGMCGLLPAADRHSPELFFPKLPMVDTEREQHWPGSAQSVWQAHAAVVADLLKRKEGYGDAWKAQGYMGNIGRVLSKQSRLRNLMWRDGGIDPSVSVDGSDADPQAETVLDTLYDLSALCAFAIANLEEGNRWGS